MMRVAANAPARPTTTPIAPILNASATMSVRTESGCAPSAIRIPISRRRWATEYDITP